MSLSDRAWTNASLHDVVLAWVRAEREKLQSEFLYHVPGFISQRYFSILLDNADVSNHIENRDRLRLLYCRRNTFFTEIPPDTIWHKVSSLTNDDLSELYIINHGEWVSPGEDNNELLRVAQRNKKPLVEPPSKWDPPVLWGHDKSGPFTILEGNNRLTAYAGSDRSELDIDVFVGLSPMKCLWHRPDNCGMIMQDLIPPSPDWIGPLHAWLHAMQNRQFSPIRDPEGAFG